MGSHDQKRKSRPPKAGCLACELTFGVRELPGGAIYETDIWRVEHCVGPLGVGTLIVKPIRHVLHVADLTAAEAAELGPLLWRAAQVVSELSTPAQVYVSLWSSGPVHIHWVVQPVTSDQEAGARGPFLQAAMFASAVELDHREAAGYAERARAAWLR
jgi:diadenosine tetraphosphate (Ap4A) HIT family hydrolase